MSPRTHIPLMLLTACFAAASAGAQTPEEKGLAIARQADAASDGFKDEQSRSEMVLINAQGDRVVRKMAMKVLEVPGDGDRSLITFEWPADVKGTRMLTWTHRKGDDDQWLFLPAFNKVRRISSQNKSGSFMGSEFAYEDIASQEVDKYTYKWLKDEKVGGRDTHVLERKPTYVSGYSRQVVWMDKEYQSAVKIEFHDRKNELLKTMILSDWSKHGKFWRVGKIEVTNHQTSKKSILTISERSLGKGADKSEFEKRNLGE